MYNNALINKLYNCGINGTVAEFNAMRNDIIANIGYDEYRSIWKQVCFRMNATGYSMVDFSSKVMSQSTDKSYVSRHTHHNED